jgi:hypothetical protein
MAVAGMRWRSRRGCEETLSTGVSRKKEKECSFLKKRTKKLFYLVYLAWLAYAPKEQKSFASFLHKRRPCCLPAKQRRARS